MRRTGRWLWIGGIAALLLTLYGAAPAPRVAHTFHVSPGGDDRRAGSARAPWRTVGRAAHTARAGDTVIIHGGVYHETLEPAFSGTGENARIVFKAAAGENAVLDGGTGRLTGWTSESNHIYRRAFAGRLFGLFQDTCETAGKHISLWDVGTRNEYEGNPHLDLHDFDPTHDYYNGTTLKKHDGSSQYKCADGVLRVRTRDGRSPDEHDVRGAAQVFGIHLDGKRFITVEGLKVRCFKSFAAIDNSPHTRLVNCDFRYAASTGIWMTESHQSEVIGCVIQAAGSWIGHYEDLAQMKHTEGARWEGNDFSFGGHGGFFIRGGSRFVLRGNTFRDTGGSLLYLKYGADDGLIEENLFARSGCIPHVSLHKVSHAAVQLGGGSRNTFRRNLFCNVGGGVTVSVNERETTNGNRFENNTFCGCEEDAIQLQAYSASNEGRLNDNVFTGNIAANSGESEVRLDIPGGETRSFWGNRFENNCFWGTELRPWGARVHVAEAEQRWPRVFHGNLEADPQFVSASEDDYRVRPGSPAANRGANRAMARARPEPSR